ncbi:hypothetical protein, partial [Acinetobacter baumannii]|uniref:hypothetical protein n=1 Tax=Acinetobacter baumannii TaxID=470 RepID=UPI001BB46E44
QVPHGCPVWRAKLGRACAGGAKPVVRHNAEYASAAAANSLRIARDLKRRSHLARIASSIHSQHAAGAVMNIETLSS